MTHKGRFMPGKQFQRLLVRHMSFVSADAIFQVYRITSIGQHRFIIIRLEESGMALLKMPDDMFAGETDVREDAHSHRRTFHKKAVRIACIVQFWKSGNGEVSDLYRLIGMQAEDEIFFDFQSSVPESFGSDVDRQLIFS